VCARARACVCVRACACVVVVVMASGSEEGRGVAAQHSTIFSLRSRVLVSSTRYRDSYQCCGFEPGPVQPPGLRRVLHSKQVGGQRGVMVPDLMRLQRLWPSPRRGVR
jgi:hypothetical protein